jgi:hypothetical protein
MRNKFAEQYERSHEKEEKHCLEREFKSRLGVFATIAALELWFPSTDLGMPPNKLALDCPTYRPTRIVQARESN